MANVSTEWPVVGCISIMASGELGVTGELVYDVMALLVDALGVMGEWGMGMPGLYEQGHALNCRGPTR